MKITLFGVCRISWDSQPFTPPRRQARALLYRLAARLEPVPRTHLAFLFWPDEPDAAARRHLTRLLSGLRAALPHTDLLAVSEESVSLNPTLCQSDSDAFWQLAGQPARLAEAAALYAGPFMADFALPHAPEYETWQQQTAVQLHHHYLRVLQTLVAQETAVAHYPAAIHYAQQYLAADELDETMHARLIALYTAVGDRTAALRQYEQCALVLERELGVSPLPATRAALQGGAIRSAAPPLPVLPSLALPLTGREVVLRQIETVVAQSSPSTTGLILLSGEPGMGKSRLLRETITRHKGLTLVGASHPGGEALPYQPLLQALRSLPPENELWTAVPPLWAAELLPLLPELATRLPHLPPLPVAAAQAQARLYEALAQTAVAFAAQSPLLLCLDDLHWADPATLGWLAYLAANRWPPGLVILAACRSPESANLAALRAAYTRMGRLLELHLAGLTAVDIHALLSHVTAAPPPDMAAQIQTTTGGNPFFILEIMRDLQESDQLTRPPTDLPLPGSVREAILTRLSALTPLARQLLEAAAVLSPHLDDHLLQQTAARSEGETADGLDELLAQGLLEMLNPSSSSGQVGQWSLVFPHGLLQTAVYQSLNPWRRKLLHRRAGEALTSLAAVDAAVLAGHFTAAEEWATAVTHYQHAAVQARTLYAYEVALAQINRAFSLLPHLPEPEAVRLALLRQRLVLRRALVQLPEWAADAADLLALATAVGDIPAQLEALEAQMSLHVLQSAFALVEETAAAALALAAQTGDRLAEARIRGTLGWHLADALGRSGEGLAQLQMACRLAREVGAQGVGETAVLYQSLCNLAFAQRAEGQCAAARASAEEALALTTYHPDSPPHPAFADALRELGEANAYLGRWEEARHQLRPLLDLYQTLNDPWAYGAVLYNYGLYSSNMGQHEEAIASLRQLVALSQAVGLPADSDYGIWHRVGLARVLLAAGQLDEAGTLLAGLQTGKLGWGRPYLAWARTVAEYHLLRGDGAAALAALEPAVDWWRQNASLHDADVLLLLAQARLIVGERGGAETAVNEAAAYLEPTDIARYHLRLHWTRYQVSGDPAALAAAHAELERQHGRFRDPALRLAFLHHVPLHRQMMDSHSHFADISYE
ncbi:MAG TPA: AAA family ATPase [Chloroflexota bacterium]|nr:AAA family ATPase [Chloroflexota bacterium]